MSPSVQNAVDTERQDMHYAVNCSSSRDLMEEVSKQLQLLINNLVKWLNCNGLALNLKKTKYMVFARSKIDLNTPLLISNTELERKGSFTYYVITKGEGGVSE